MNIHQLSKERKQHLNNFYDQFFRFFIARSSCLEKMKEPTLTKVHMMSICSAEEESHI